MRTLKGIIIILVLFTIVGWSHYRERDDVWGRSENEWGRIVDGGFSPADIPGLQLWLTADKGAESDSNGTPASDGALVFFLRDQSSQSNDAAQGVNAQRPTYIGGQPNSIRFDGTDDLLDCGDDNSIDGFTDFTVCIWIKGAASADNQNLIGKEEAYELYAGGTTIRMETYCGGQRFDWGPGTATILDDTWHFAVVVRKDDATQGYYYVDGALTSTKNNVGTGAIDTTATPLELSGNYYSRYRFNGRIGDLLIYNRALTSNEIIQLWRAGQ